ncbi:MAG: lipoyl(octanoyl) transferase LipB [Gemmatimonadota bacterium]|nr:lipoyl(octanoyl) transferase LipB [Gemmatimonadota bacterium]MDQ8149709.1 lipoyl(octanoyl) transferase LipB [Gemmatimonadota bacterium]MDQ8157371.1 lipoyl(octanoyl) transferase LipB [Gemmatimonadota bacterium]MDQ8177187.1 lipoyl(octanoyl) transferase LipB [Gemmatimonadota bacterium]
MSEFLVLDLGLRDYAEALSFQRDLAAARLAGRVAHDVLLLVEHPPVITLGRSSKAAHLLASPEALASRGVALHEVERGGDVTFHGPGQLVGYPIVDLTGHKQDLHWYLRQVEEVLIQAVWTLGLHAERNPGKTGVWTGGRKLASIGVHARQWVTWHGFALNVTTDLAYFDLMVPCGIADVTMTSVAAELASADPDALAASTRSAVIDAFGARFSRTPRRVTQIEH